MQIARPSSQKGRALLTRRTTAHGPPVKSSPLKRIGARCAMRSSVKPASTSLAASLVHGHEATAGVPRTAVGTQRKHRAGGLRPRSRATPLRVGSCTQLSASKWKQLLVTAAGSRPCKKGSFATNRGLRARVSATTCVETVPSNRQVPERSGDAALRAATVVADRSWDRPLLIESHHAVSSGGGRHGNVGGHGEQPSCMRRIGKSTRVIDQLGQRGLRREPTDRVLALQWPPAIEAALSAKRLWARIESRRLCVLETSLRQSLGAPVPEACRETRLHRIITEMVVELSPAESTDNVMSAMSCFRKRTAKEDIGQFSSVPEPLDAMK